MTQLGMQLEGMSEQEKGDFAIRTFNTNPQQYSEIFLRYYNVSLRSDHLVPTCLIESLD